MRPLRLELKGFSAFRETTVIDFDDVDLFVLVGPTGSGKSSIIDGIVFALYGSVVRYKKTNLVAPSINQVSTEARVSLDFSVGDTAYRAVRVVRRTATGATTKEARLESGDEVLAGNARELDEAVEKILGLDFNQFTKTVVLPQGDFARFLTESSGDRQNLLRRLLGMEQYRRVGSAARERARTAASQADALAEQLSGAAGVGEADVKALTSRRKKLEAAEAKVLDAVSGRDAAAAELAEAEAALVDVDDRLERLAALEVPEEISGLDRDVVAADRAVTSAERAVAAARKKHDAATAKVDGTPGPAELEDLIERHEALAERKQQITELRSEVSSMQMTLDKAVSEAESSATALTAAQDAASEARLRAGAAGLVELLHIGERCPVCHQTVEDLPSHDPVQELGELDDAVLLAQSAVRDATAAVTSATADVAATQTQLDAVEVDATSLSKELKDEPTLANAKRQLKTAIARHEAIEAAQESLDDAESELETAGATRAELDDVQVRMRLDFVEARDLVSSDGPPTPGGTNLVEDWSTLVTFAREKAAAVKAERKNVASGVNASTKVVTGHERTIARTLKPFVENEVPEDPARWITTELSRSQAQETALLERRELMATAKTKIDGLRQDARVAAELGRLVSATGFEQWLMVDVMDDLAQRATGRLHELSGGAYSLVADSEGGEFAIRDHRNADEVRPTRTLSGGETFLASLSLALALADSVAELSPEGVPPIESMFLDEGFGTLDPETLDVVAGAIEELGAAGRMVGVVTHIRELADRIPTRFEVTRSPTTSSVARTDGV